MVLPLTQVPGGKHVYTYDGPCGVVGMPATQTFDLTVIPENVRKSVLFRQQLWAIYEAVAPGGVFAVDPLQNAIISPPTGLPETLEVEITSVDANAGLRVRLEAPHTVKR